jgi:hypothetical protein
MVRPAPIIVLSLAFSVSACNFGSAGGATGAAGAPTTGAAGSSTGAAGATTGAAGAGAAGTGTGSGAAGDGSSAGSGAAAGETGSAGATGAAGAAGTGAAGVGAAGMGAAGTGAPSGKIGSLTFTRKDLHRLNLSEAVAVADYNKDGFLDVLSGPFWWEGPAFDKMHQLNMGTAQAPFCSPATASTCNCYTCMSLGDWAEYPYDVDGDGWVDAVEITRPSFPSYWYKNPGTPSVNTDTAWSQHEISTLLWEQSQFVDISGTGKPGLVGVDTNGNFGWWDPTATSPWPFHVIATGGGTYPWEHGLGTGMNVTAGTGMNFIMRTGWFTPPAGGPLSGPWTKHAYDFSNDGQIPGGSHHLAYDVNGDGLMDVLASPEAHGYGLNWFEQKPAGTFTKHVLVGKVGTTTGNVGNIASFSQVHVLMNADVDGDGLKDMVAGKVWYAHPPGIDPGAADTPVYYIFKLIRDPAMPGGATYEPHLIDSEVGLGKGGPVVVDLNGDGLPDIATASKHGVFIFFQKP